MQKAQLVLVQRQASPQNIWFEPLCARYVGLRHFALVPEAPAELRS